MMRIFFYFYLCGLVHGNKDIRQCPPSRTAIENSLQNANIPGLAAIVINSTDILFEQAFGYNSPLISNTRQSTDPRKTIFVVASISKTFIAVTVMQLVECQHLDLDQDINQYLSPHMDVLHPWYPNISITMRHILSHTSSIGPNFEEEIKHYLPNDDFTKTNLSDIIRSYIHNNSNWLSNPPGTVVHYSNIGASLAAFIVERISQISFEEYVRDKILQPLEIRRGDAGYRLSNFEDRKEDLIEHYLFNFILD